MIKKIYILVIVFILISYSAKLYAQDTTLNYFINIGLKNNLALKQKKAKYQQSIYEIKEASGKYFPEIKLNSRLTVADGGRIIDLPIGDMLNPVYNSLNFINPQFGLPADFPAIENQEIDFYRAFEHESKIELIQPIFNTSIYFNKKIQQELSKAKYADLKVYKRLLVFEIKKAYYSYLKTLKINQILSKTKTLIDENIRVNESLFNNNKITKDKLYRAKAELCKFENKIIEGKKAKKMAEAYMNFLLNRDLNTPIEIAPEISDKIHITNSVPDEENIHKREELEQLEYSLTAVNKSIMLYKYKNAPYLTAVVDYGFQGSEISFTEDNDFVLASIVLKWDLFAGFQNRAKVKKTIIEKEILQDFKTEVEKKIELEKINILYELEAAQNTIYSSKNEMLSMQEAFKLVNKKYKEGQVNQIEYLDAQTNYINSQLKYTISKYEYLIKKAEYEKVNATFQFNKID